eukprot:2164597-Rhodomonas_salina.1
MPDSDLASQRVAGSAKNVHAPRTPPPPAKMVARSSSFETRLLELGHVGNEKVHVLKVNPEEVSADPGRRAVGVGVGVGVGVSVSVGLRGRDADVVVGVGGAPGQKPADVPNGCNGEREACRRTRHAQPLCALVCCELPGGAHRQRKAASSAPQGRRCAAAILAGSHCGVWVADARVCVGQWKTEGRLLVRKGMFSLSSEDVTSSSSAVSLGRTGSMRPTARLVKSHSVELSHPVTRRDTMPNFPQRGRLSVDADSEALRMRRSIAGRSFGSAHGEEEERGEEEDGEMVARRR